MKPSSAHLTSCSCNSCVYRSRSKEPNVQQLIQGGTDIDKLYYGKFLPLRERKLLEKLIRTRDAYDDVRNQLLSSASSVQKSRAHEKKRRDKLSTENSSVVIKMVDLVDRGQIRSAKTSKLNSCCSCCSCETLKKIRKRMEKDKHKHPCVNKHIVTCEDIAKYCAEAEKRGRKRRSKLSTKISSKFSSKIGATRLKMRKHLSEPILSLSSVAARSSKAYRKLRSKRKAIERAQGQQVMTIDQETKVAKPPRKLGKKVKYVQSSTTKDSGTEVRSLKTFKIKKDSILLFKEKLLKKRPYEENKDVECEPGTCNTDECIPEECLKKIKAKGVGDTRKRKYHTRHSVTGRDRSHISKSSRTKIVKVRDSQIQDGPSPKFAHTVTTILKTKLMPSYSKTEIKGKRSVSPKQRQQSEKGTGNQDKAYKLTKSSTSMTSISKSKAKGQSAIKEEKVAPKVKPKAKLQIAGKDKRLEDKGIRVQYSPHSCECELFTKSSSSLTSAPKKKSHSKRIKTHAVASPPTGRKRDRQKPRLESYHNFMETDLYYDPMEHVKSKREKRMKPTHAKIKQRKKHKHSKTQVTGILSKESQESYLRDSANQAKDLPFPRECEPLMCIPYECDPEKCAEILLSRSKSRDKSVTTDKDRLRRKSVGSTAFSQRTSQKTSSRSRTKSKDKQSKSAENFIRKPKYISKEPPPQIVEKSYPDRNTVKITSSFSFDIEFYKDTYVNDDEKKDLVSVHEKQIKQKDLRKKYKDQRTEYISSSQNISSQSRSSQSFQNIQVGHRLKRCFCTLKLLPKKKQKLKHVISKRTMVSLNDKELDIPRKKRTQTKSLGIAYVVPPATSPRSTQASLLPYECEPYFCTPGECDPYECAERIKQRNRRSAKHVSKDTNTTVTPKKSKLASTPKPLSKSTSKPCDCHPQTSIVKVSSDELERQTNEHRHIKHKGRHSPSSNVEREVSEKQVVRIGSNFNFNVEFSKTTIDDQKNADTLRSDEPTKRQKRHFHDKGIRVNKPHAYHKTSETNKYDKTKKTNTEPFLQRCLCTLKLLKKNKKKGDALSPWQNRNEYVLHMQKKSVTANRAEICYNPGRSRHLPYEWEHGLYIPKECDPYNSENFIKSRHMLLQHKYSNIFSGDNGCRSTFSKTSRTVTKSPNCQSFTKEKLKRRSLDYNEINIIPSHSKQRVMQIVSKTSLKMSRYEVKDNFITTENKINTHVHNKDNSDSKGSQQLDCPVHRNSIDAEAKPKEKGSYVFAAIKRCFSTFKFQKTKNKTGLENNDVISENIKASSPLQNSQLCEYPTRLSNLHFGLNKCAPNFCIPEMCDPHECCKESKQREIKGLHDIHHVSTDRHKGKSAMSLTSTASDFSTTKMTKSAKSTSLLKRTTIENQKVRDKQRDMKAARSFSRSRQAGRKGSNLSINNEISKHRFMHRVEMYKTISDTPTVNRMTDKGTKNKRVDLKHNLSKVNEIGREVHGSNVGFLLKRCFCTLSLQKKNKPKPEFRWHQPTTAQFLQVKQNRHEIRKPGCEVLNKALHGGKPLKLKSPEGDQYLRKNLIENESSNPLPNNRSFSRRAHVRSRVEMNFDKMKSLLNTQKINPFYRSFFALNVKVSKSNNISHNKYRALKDNERNPDECPPNECDPVDCSKKVNRLRRRPREPDTVSMDSQFSCYKKCKKEFEKQKRKGPLKPVTYGSDLSIRAGVYKDTNPYKSQRTQALRLGSDVRLNFDFFKEPPSRGFCKTGPIYLHETKEAGRSPARPTDLQVYRETQSKVTGISHMIQRCFCASKLKNATNNDINQIRDETRMYRDNPRYKSTSRFSFRREKQERPLYRDESRTYRDNPRYKSTSRFSYRREKQEKPLYREDTRMYRDNPRNKSISRLSYRREKQERNIKSKSVQYNDHLQQHRKKSRKDNNVTFCTNVNCAEFYSDQNQNKAKFNHVQERGEGDVGKEKDAIADKKNVIDKCLCALKSSKSKKKDKKNKQSFIDKCYCALKHLKGQEGKRLSLKPSMEMIGNGEKKCKRLAEAESAMETIMPYSKRKFKKLESQSVLREDTYGNTKQYQQGFCPTCQTQCQPITLDSKKKGKKLNGQSKLVEGANQFTEEQLQGICETCKLKLTNKDIQNLTPGTKVCKNCKPSGKNTCFCPKDLTPPEKGKRKKGGRAPVVDNTPLFEMTVNKANMRIVNKDEVLKKLGTIDKETNVMKKSRAAVKAGKVGPPEMEMILDSGKASILNSEQVIHKINQKISNKAREKRIALDPTRKNRYGQEPALPSKTKKSGLKALLKSHGDKCKCCICHGMKKGKRAQTAMYTQKLRPCVCGSVLCKKDWDKIYQEQKSRAAVKIKKCVCGSNVCAEESSKMPELLLHGARQAQHEKEMAKKAIMKKKLNLQQRKKRAKEQKRAFKKQKKIRKKQDKREMKSIKKSEDYGNVSVVAESLIDLGTFGSKAFCDVAGYVCRSIAHPKDAYSDVKMVVKDPGAAAKSIQKHVKAMGLFSTFDRTKERLSKLPAAKTAVSKLEAYPTTNYLFHIADKDPKKRMKKFKTKHKREPLDFQCSLYMASMRRRPCLRIYYMCPWFYPHCLSLLNVWKQFMDVLLFLLAVVVWSPCILCMELCRGFVCCGLCQG